MRLTITFLLTTIFLVAKAQDPSSALLLQSGTVYPQSNIEEFISTPIESGEITDGYYYRIIQFSEYPDLKLQNDIVASGIILSNYLPYRSYNAAIPVSFDRNKARSLKISSVMKWDNRFKLDQKINGMDFPTHTIIEKGSADVVVHCQQNVSDDRASEILTKSGFRIVSTVELANSFTIRLSFEKLNDLLAVPIVYFVEPISMPSVKDDTEGRSLHRSNFINSEFVTGRHYDGNGVVIGLADDGQIGPHIDFEGRVIQHLTGFGGNHGDMTSGICVGAGNLNPHIRGMATGATLHVFDISTYPQILNAVYNYNNYGVVITSTSYAQDCNKYNADTRLGDQIIRLNPQFSFCFSAGNAGESDCGWGAGSTWGNITGGYKMGKNVIAVGNLRNNDSLESSSSRGPAVDGRIKPEICSNGYDQRSTDQSNTYQVGGGTSAACPGVAGCLAQLYQAYKQIYNTSYVPSALMKACILNTAEDLGNPGPDFKFGWGRIDAYRALREIENGMFFPDSVSQNQSHTQTITVPAGTTELRVMVYWHDIEGVSNSAKNLVNDLNLSVTRVQTGQVFLPLVLDSRRTLANITADAVPGVDSLNNAEQVRIANPVAGTYDIHVDGFQVPVGIQKYFIVYDFGNDSVTLTYPNGGEGLEPNEIELIRWDATGSAGTFDLDFSDNGGTTWSNIATGIPGDKRQYQWIVPITVSDQFLMRISRGVNSDESDTMFTVLNSPANLHVTFVCPDSIGLAWTAVSGAPGYEVSMLGSKYMDFAGTTNATDFIVTGLIPTDEHWFSVKALGPHGGKGCRANAIHKPAGVTNCSLMLDGGISIVSPDSGIISDCQNLTSYPVIINIMNPGVNAFSNFSYSYMLDNASVVTQTEAGWIASGMNVSRTFTQPLSLTPGHHSLKVWFSVSGDLNFYNDTATSTFDIIPGTTGTTGVEEPFTSFPICSSASSCGAINCTLGNGWINATNNVYDDIDWRVDTGETQSLYTGPEGDHTSGTGNYIYLEASQCYDKEAVLISPCYDLLTTSNPVFTFWYHMYGASMGELHVDVLASDGVHSDIIPSRIGDQGDSWKKDSVMLSQFYPQTISIRFRGITGSDGFSDMALDDIGLFDSPNAVEEISLENLFRIYPNPSNGIFNYSMKNNTELEIRIADIMGKTIWRNKISGNGTIDLTMFPSGVYTAIVSGENRSVQIKLMDVISN
jgi:hypothetical protein